MKKIIILLISLLNLSCGTDQGEGVTYVYTVINESGETIEIKSYISYLPDVAPIVTIVEDGQTLTKTYKDGLPPSGYSFKNFFGNDTHRDSIVVIYNNEKITLFEDDCSNERNPLNNCLYRNAKETFTFTQEDYANATSCNGNCD